MMNHYLVFGRALAGLVLSACAASVSALPLFTNNSFESSFSGWSQGGSCDTQGFGFDGTSSIGCAVFNGGASFETVSQTVGGFTVGESYELSFYQQNNGRLLSPYDDGRASWEVRIDGVPTFFSDLMDPGETVWSRQSFDFTASAPTLSFLFSPFDIDNGAALPGDSGVYPVLDLIGLALADDDDGGQTGGTAVPAPGTLALFALGMLVLRLRRRT